MMPNIFVVGSGGHAGVVIHTIEAQGKFKIVGLLDDYQKSGTVKYGHMVQGDLSDVVYLASKHDVSSLFIAIGNNEDRHMIFHKLKHFEFNWPHIIHPEAYVFPTAQIEAGVLIAAGAVVGPNAKVGRFSIVNTNASLDHDAGLGEFSHMAPNSATGGHSSIGDYTLIGIGACIRDRVKVGNKCVVGMGSAVVADVADGKTAYGNPCRCK